MQFPELEVSHKKATKYVKRLGHADLSRYQEWYGMEPDDILGPITLSQLMQPRCGVPDFAGREEAKWPTSCRHVTVTYDFDSISSVIAAAAWKLALDKWNEVCGINLDLVRNNSRGQIWATDGPLPGSTLAWSFLANDSCDAKLQQKYDTTTSYTVEFLTKIIFHEVGHALGLQHTNRRADIMYPSISGAPWSNYPSENDISRVVSRYGEPEPVPEPPTPPDTPGGPIAILDGGFSVVTGGRVVKLKVIESSGL